MYSKGKSRQGADRKKKIASGHIPLSGAMSEMLWGSWAEARLNKDPKGLS